MDVVSVSAGDDRCMTVSLCGEIDYTNAAGVLDAVRAAIGQERPGTVRMNLAAVTFLDSSGIAVLVKVMKAARDAEADFLVTSPGPRVLDQLRMTGLTDLFAVDEAAPAPIIPR